MRKQRKRGVEQIVLGIWQGKLLKMEAHLTMIWVLNLIKELNLIMLKDCKLLQSIPHYNMLPSFCLKLLRAVMLLVTCFQCLDHYLQTKLVIVIISEQFMHQMLQYIVFPSNFNLLLGYKLDSFNKWPSKPIKGVRP